MKLSELKKGDVVRLIPGTRYYKQNTPSNPAEMDGIYDGRSFVKWENGRINSYQDGDLMLAERIEIPQIFN